MGIETNTRKTISRVSWYFSTIRHYDGDWNMSRMKRRYCYRLLFNHSPLWWGLKPASMCPSLLQIDLFNHSPLWWGLKHLRIKATNKCALLFNHSPLWWGLKLVLHEHQVCPCGFSTIRHYDGDWNLKILLHEQISPPLFNHSPLWWGLKLRAITKVINSSQLFNHSPLWWGLKQESIRRASFFDDFSTIRHYDGDWN